MNLSLVLPSWFVDMVTSSAEEIVSAKRICRSFGPGIDILTDVDLLVKPGETIALTGRSGSGKSTLLNILGLLDRPTSGSLVFAGTDLAGEVQKALARIRRENIGFVFQDSLVDPSRRAHENVELALRARDMSRRERRDSADAALESVGLGHRLSAMANTLSGGERQRVAIARAIVHRPLLLLADEPTGNLDDDAAEQVIALLLGYARSGRSVIVVTHDMGLASRTDRSARLSRGSLNWDE